MKLLIQNGRVLDPASKTDAVRDVLIESDCIAQVGEKLSAPGAEVFDATGLCVAPGFIDLHCHLREPGFELSETIATGLQAAARGGFTAVCPMPNTRPVNDNASVTLAMLDRARAACGVRVWPIGAASQGSQGQSLAEIAGMKQAGIVGVSDDGRPIATAKLLRQVMEYCRALDLPVIDHCEDPSLFAGCCMREGRRSVELGLAGMPACTESIAVARDIEVCALTGARFHVAHLSARASLAMVRAAKAQGLPVTCEVTPHHITLCDDDVRYDTRYKMNPPLAATGDRAALIEGLRDGTVDAIATDHAPHAAHLKDVEFDQAPFGVTGFETALPLALEELHRKAGIPLLRIVELFTTGPARVLGPASPAQGHRTIAASEPADITLFSLDRSWTFSAADSLSLSKNSPFDGRQFHGCAAATIVAGRIAWKA
jgi:dihydroorotase